MLIMLSLVVEAVENRFQTDMSLLIMKTMGKLFTANYLGDILGVIYRHKYRKVDMPSLGRLRTIKAWKRAK